MKISERRAKQIRMTWRCFDFDMAMLFRNIQATKSIPLNCALYIQYLNREIGLHGNQDGFTRITNEEIRLRYLEFLTTAQIRKTFRALVKLRIVSVKDRVYKKINVPVIVSLAKAMKRKMLQNREGDDTE